ncbi:hypothetical protein QS257_19935 [Terrilactibacillus sp. S3-3]|nr:hypothetical protein QS257_19935 [Terrilactibacillus sp. S3-3]
MRNDTLWTNFILPMSIVGLGNGLLVSPMAVVAMKGVKIEVAGAASGVMNTVRQLGAVGGSAAVGALLQNRILAVSTPFHRSTEYVTAIKETMILPIVVILVGIAACAAAHRTIQLADPHKEAG